jgi:hypothetical protein
MVKMFYLVFLSSKVMILIPPLALPGGKNPSGIKIALTPKVSFGIT